MLPLLAVLGSTGLDKEMHFDVKSVRGLVMRRKEKKGFLKSEG